MLIGDQLDADGADGGADLLFTGLAYQEIAGDVAEYYDIRLATLHYVPVRGNGQLLPAPLGRSEMKVREWAIWRISKKLEDAQRRELGLPKATRPSFRRITERGSLEIRPYDAICFPGLAAELANWDGQRPFIGALTMELPTDADEEVASWIAVEHRRFTSVLAACWQNLRPTRLLAAAQG